MQLVEEESILIKEATKKGFKEAYEGDGVDIGSRMESHRGTVQRGMAQTLKTSGDEVGVVVVGNYSPSNHNAARVVDSKGCAPTVMENHGTVTAIVEKPLYSDYSMKKIVGNIVQDDICGTITSNAMQSINHDNCHLIVEKEENLKTKMCNDLIESGKVKENDVIRHSYSSSRMKGEMKDIQPLDTRCDCLGVVVDDGVINPLKDKTPYGWHFEQQVYDKEGITRTVKAGGGSGNIPKVIESKDSLFSEIEKQLFTEDGNIKRYINSEIVDKFEEGQMATTSYPNGYGHGPRTHNESISLNTIDKPVVKQNLRIRKLTPKECFRLMGVKDEDYEHIAKNQSDASLYHLAGDSIVTTCIAAMFSQFFDIDWRGKLWWH